MSDIAKTVRTIIKSTDSIIGNVLKSMTSLAGNVIKSVFYATLCAFTFTCMFLYNTKPNMTGLSGYIANTYFIDDYMFFNIASIGSLRFIGIANNWMHLI